MTVNKSDNSRLNILEIQLQSNTLAFIVLCERSQIKLLYQIILEILSSRINQSIELFGLH